MPAIDNLKKERLKKLKAIISAGFSPYPINVKRTHTCLEAIENFAELEKSKKEVILAGRIISLREHGALTFSHIKDGTGSLQLLFRRDRLGIKSYQFFLKNFDIGDFIEARGTLFKTKRASEQYNFSQGITC